MEKGNVRRSFQISFIPNVWGSPIQSIRKLRLNWPNWHGANRSNSPYDKIFCVLVGARHVAFVNGWKF